MVLDLIEGIEEVFRSIFSLLGRSNRPPRHDHHQYRHDKHKYNDYDDCLACFLIGTPRSQSKSA